MGGCDEKIEAEITKANYVLRVVCNGMPLIPPQNLPSAFEPAQLFPTRIGG
jgi:hypothetical protein